MKSQKRPVSSVIWHEQFDAKFDLAGVPPTVRYVLCTTPRSGSHFLGHLLQRSGCFGYPLEYFNPLNLSEWRKRASAEGFADVVSFLEHRRTSPNGCFGVKVHYDHLSNAIAALGLGPLIKHWRFILLRRQDVLGQAISWARASQTGVWISGMPEQAPASYDRAAIAYRLTMALEHTTGWQRFLAENGIMPLELTYEDVMAHPAAAVERIADFLEVDLCDQVVGEGLRTEMQRSRLSDEWRERYIDEMRERYRKEAARRRWTPEAMVVRREPLVTRVRRFVRKRWRRGDLCSARRQR